MRRATDSRVVQMTLDFGQKNSGPQFCSECNLVYISSDAKDLKEHAKHHAKCVNRKFRVARWNNQKVVEEYFDGSRVIEISSDDQTGVGLFRRLSNCMDRDLGQDMPNSDKPSSELLVPPYLRIFIFVEGMQKNAVGCCIAEELTARSIAARGYSVRRLVGGRPNLLSWRVLKDIESENSNKSSSNINFSNASLQSILLPLCGIRRLWVAPEHRRKKVASTLVDCVLQNLFYLTHLTRKQVAFSEPTANGADFAYAFTLDEEFLIY